MKYYKLNKTPFFIVVLFFMFLFPKFVLAQVKFLDSTLVTRDAFYFWKADDPKPFHYGASINPHGNCVKVSNGFIFFTWYRGGWADRTLMISRKKIGQGNWVHVALPAKLSLVNGKGDTHLTTNVGICTIDGTVHLMFDHHNEDLNYIQSKKNIAFGPDSEFTAANFLPQQDFLIAGKKVTGVTYPDLFNNDLGEMYFERRLGSAVGGNIIMTFYNGNNWSPETTIIQGTGTQVSQGERNFAYGGASFINGKFYYTYSVRWAESPTTLNEGVYLMELGSRMNDKATTVDGKSYNLPIIDHKPFLIADPRSVPTSAGWAGGPQVAISPKNDIYLYQTPKNTTHYNYLKKQDESSFIEDRGKGSLGSFYGNRMYRFATSGEDLVINSCLAGSYNWREDFRLKVGSRFRKSIQIMDNGTIVAVYAGAVNSDKVPIYNYVFQIEKSDYAPQTISFAPLAERTEGDADFALVATATSNLPVKFKSSNDNIAQIIEGNKVKIVGVGSCTIIAQQTGDGTFDAAPDVIQALVVNPNLNKTSQTINFNLINKTHVWGDAEQSLSATATSGLTVNFESTNTNVAEILNGKLIAKQAGTTMVKAIQIGNETFNAAPIVSYEFTVPARQQTITFDPIPEVTSGDPVFQLKAVSNNPNAKLRFVLPNNQVAIVWSDYVMQVLGPGTGTITVSEEGDDSFQPAQATRTITVKPKTHVLPADIEAEYFTTKSNVAVTRWSNSVFYLNNWGANDFAEYTIDVPADGSYSIEVFAASPNTSKRIDVMIGNTKLATINLTVTSSLTVFRSSKANINLTKGIHKIRIVGVIGGFNFDRMKITNGQGGGEPQENIYKLKNVATGKYLTSSGSVIVASDSGIGLDKEWLFVPTTLNSKSYYNIDSKVNGVLRATGLGHSEPYIILSTTKAPPTQDVDKIWTLHYDEFDDTYRFEVKDSGRFLYHETDGKFYNLPTDENDERSKWQVETYGESLLNVEKNVLKISSVRVYPNPAKDKFTIEFNKMNPTEIKIYTILGKLIYEQKITSSKLEINLPTKFTTGVYLLKVINNNNKIHYSKLIIE